MSRNQYKNKGRGAYSPKLVARASEPEKKATVDRAEEIGISESELIRSALALAFRVWPLEDNTARLLRRAGWLDGPPAAVLPDSPTRAPRKPGRTRGYPPELSAPLVAKAAEEDSDFSFVDLTKPRR